MLAVLSYLLFSYKFRENNTETCPFIDVKIVFDVCCVIFFSCKALEQEVVNELEAAGMETKVVKRYQYNDEVVKWADLVVTTGKPLILNIYCAYLTLQSSWICPFLKNLDIIWN